MEKTDLTHLMGMAKYLKELTQNYHKMKKAQKIATTLQLKLILDKVKANLDDWTPEMKFCYFRGFVDGKVTEFMDFINVEVDAKYKDNNKQ